MPIAEDFARLLDLVQRPGDFYTQGNQEIAAPRLTVEGIGPIALPLLPVQAAQLIAAAERAPYGRGADTLVDTAVRRSWQIGPDKLSITGRGWARTLEAIVARAAEGLGVTGPVAASFYKMLIYDEGSFFVSHRDSEKVPGMFATLIIVLPSFYTGGELVIRHQGREVRVDPRCDEPSEAGFVAFYADCIHEVLPTTSGCRLTLVYNLSRRGLGTQPGPPNYTVEQTKLAALLDRWSQTKKSADDAAPEKLIYPLEHQYTAESLSFAVLKGADAAKAAALSAAAGAAGCDMHLALVSIEEHGSAHYNGDYHRYSENADDFEEIEVLDRFEKLSHWRHPTGGNAELGELPIAGDEISPPDALADLAPDEESFHEATGNEGASFERSYRRAALVLWPSHRRLVVMSQGGLSATLPYLAQLTAEWQNSGQGRDAPLWAEAHELTFHMLSAWPRNTRPDDKVPGPGARFLALLGQLDDSGRTEEFLARLAADGMFSKADNEQIVFALRRLPPARAADLLQRIITVKAAEAIDACADLLARTAKAALGAFDMQPAAAALVAGLPGNANSQVSVPSWHRPQPPTPQWVIDALDALCLIHPASADVATGVFLGQPRIYDMDRVLIPACLALGTSKPGDAPAVARLQRACLDHLRARIALPLVPPADWARDSTLTCKCNHCTELGRFLADPARASWNFKAVQHDRSHVESTIRSSDCDVSTSTIRRGSPHILECTKTQASYERRARQRQKDLEDLEDLARFEAARP